MADSDTRKAAIKAVSDLLTANSVDLNTQVAWENTKFAASGKDEWFRVTYNPTDPSPITLGLGGRDRMRGFIQVDINAGLDVGVSFFDNWLDLFRAEFYAGKTFTYGSGLIRILTVGMSGGRVFENSWFRKSVTITFRTDLTRNSTP